MSTAWCLIIFALVVFALPGCGAKVSPGEHTASLVGDTNNISHDSNSTAQHSVGQFREFALRFLELHNAEALFFLALPTIEPGPLDEGGRIIADGVPTDQLINAFGEGGRALRLPNLGAVIKSSKPSTVTLQFVKSDSGWQFQEGRAKFLDISASTADHRREKLLATLRETTRRASEAVIQAGSRPPGGATPQDAIQRAAVSIRAGSYVDFVECVLPAEAQRLALGCLSVEVQSQVLRARMLPGEGDASETPSGITRKYGIDLGKYSGSTVVEFTMEALPPSATPAEILSDIAGLSTRDANGQLIVPGSFDYLTWVATEPVIEGSKATAHLIPPSGSRAQVTQIALVQERGRWFLADLAFGSRESRDLFQQREHIAELTPEEQETLDSMRLRPDGSVVIGPNRTVRFPGLKALRLTSDGEIVVGVDGDIEVRGALTQFELDGQRIDDFSADEKRARILARLAALKASESK